MPGAGAVISETHREQARSHSDVAYIAKNGGSETGLRAITSAQGGTIHRTKICAVVIAISPPGNLMVPTCFRLSASKIATSLNVPAR